MSETILGMPMPAYLKHPALAHHDLAHFGRTPLHFKTARETPEEEPTDAMKIGSAAHVAILETHRFKQSIWVRPETYEDKGATKVWNSNSNVCRDWLAAHSDRPIIRAKDFENIIAMRKAVKEHPVAREILRKGNFEVSVFATDPETEVAVKARPDWVSGNCLINLKTTDDASKEAFARSIANFGYHVAAAFHIDVCRWAGLPKEFYVFIVCEREKPNAVALYQLDEESIEVGRAQYKRWLATYALCSATDEWPGYEEAIQRISLPMWSVRKAQAGLVNF